MGVQVSLTDLTTDAASSTVPINTNNQAIEVAFNKTLDRTDQVDNAMEAPLDMGLNQIINLPAPMSPSDVPTKGYVDTAVQTVLLDPAFTLNPNPIIGSGILLTDPLSLGLPTIEIQSGTRLLCGREETAPGGFSAMQDLSSFEYTGGTPTQFNFTRQIQATASENNDDSIGALGCYMYSSSNSGNNSAVAAQSNRVSGIGSITGLLFEVVDQTGSSSFGKGRTAGINMQILANDLDTAGNRVGIEVRAGRYQGTGSSNQMGDGIIIGALFDTAVEGTYVRGITISGCTDSDFLSQSAASVYAYKAVGTYVVGIGLDEGTYTNDIAIRMGAGQQIAFDAAGTITVRYDSSGDNLEFLKGGVVKQTFSMT